jgi:hypothetical protein
MKNKKKGIFGNGNFYIGVPVVGEKEEGEKSSSVAVADPGFTESGSGSRPFYQIRIYRP